MVTVFEPRMLATTIGSLPHRDVSSGTELIFKHTPKLPSWAQFPKRTAFENMMRQFTEGMPALKREGDRDYIDSSRDDFTDSLTDFYERYLAATESGDQEALESFGISIDYAAGFHEYINRLPEHLSAHDTYMLKGQVTGPVTLGINILDYNKKCAYYDEELRDVIVKTVEMKALWQLDRLKRFELPCMIFLDEPSLLGFGKQDFITISRDDVLGDINSVVGAIHDHGALAGVHCEENTDWSILMETDLDILDFDAFDHMTAMTLYPGELGAFFDRGGILGWGIVPTLDLEAAAEESVESLIDRFESGVSRFEQLGFERDLILRRTLLTPSCGAGGVLTEPLAERVLGLLRDISRTLRVRYF
jgi:hypothetical protein